MSVTNRSFWGLHLPRQSHKTNSISESQNPNSRKIVLPVFCTVGVPVAKGPCSGNYAFQSFEPPHPTPLFMDPGITKDQIFKTKTKLTTNWHHLSGCIILGFTGWKKRGRISVKDIWVKWELSVHCLCGCFQACMIL